MPDEKSEKDTKTFILKQTDKKWVIWLKRIGWGILIWTILFVWVTVLLFALKTSVTIQLILTWLAVIIVGWVASYYTSPKTTDEAIITGLLWVIIGLILDRLITYNFNSQIFADWKLLVGYFVLFMTPVIKYTLKK